MHSIVLHSITLELYSTFNPAAPGLSFSVLGGVSDRGKQVGLQRSPGSSLGVAVSFFFDLRSMDSDQLGRGNLLIYEASGQSHAGHVLCYRHHMSQRVPSAFRQCARILAGGWP